MMVFGTEMMRDTVFGVVGHFESAQNDGLAVHVISWSLALIIYQQNYPQSQKSALGNCERIWSKSSNLSASSSKASWS